MTDEEILTYFKNEEDEKRKTTEVKEHDKPTIEDKVGIMKVLADMNLIQDISELPKGGMIQGICDKLGIDIRRVRCVCASPPCETLSHADASNISRGHYYRDHSDATKPPRTLNSCINQADFDKRNKAMKDDKMIQNLIESMCKDRSQGVNYDVIIENPLGSLRHRPYMHQEGIVEIMTRTTVDYCAFGKPYKKPTDLWSSFGYMPGGNTGNGKCNSGLCGHTTTSKHGKPKHRLGIACEATRRLAGKHIKQQLWSLPLELTKELMEQLHRAPCEESIQDGIHIPKDVIIDLFSGGESWREITEEYGYEYIPVDIEKPKEKKEPEKEKKGEIKARRSQDVRMQ